MGIFVSWPVEQFIHLVIPFFLATNDFTSANVSVEIQVQMPVENLTGLEIRAPLANTSRPETVTLVRTSGDFFLCFWDFGDGTPVVEMTYENFLQTNGSVDHIFVKHGTQNLFSYPVLGNLTRSS